MITKLKRPFDLVYSLADNTGRVEDIQPGDVIHYCLVEDGQYFTGIVRDLHPRLRSVRTEDIMQGEVQIRRGHDVTFREIREAVRYRNGEAHQLVLGEETT